MRYSLDEKTLPRLSPEILKYVDYFLAWGAETSNILNQNRNFSPTNNIITGNPSFDLLNKRYRNYYREKSLKIKKKYNDFVLINTKFGRINHFDKNLDSKLLLYQSE